MLRYIIFSILGAFTALVLGMVLGIGQYIGSGNMSILGVIILGAAVGVFIGYLINKRS